MPAAFSSARTLVILNDGYRSAGNDNIVIHHNHITQNSGLRGGGGIAIFTGADDYEITENYICGNRTLFKGAGIGHIGLSDNGWISDNDIAFNESFYGTAIGGEGGGIFIGGQSTPAAAPAGTLSPGSGSVSIVANILKGNLAGSGNGGAIRTFFVNGQDVVAWPSDPDNWYTVNIFNNKIADNITGVAGAIALADNCRVRIISNTIANNDSTATGANAFIGAAAISSTAQPAGIVSNAHSRGLASAIGTGAGPEFSDFSNPILEDNILWHNRSFYWDANLGAGAGALVPNADMPHWDLAVVGTTTSEYMEPSYCVLSTLTDSTGADYDDGTNLVVDPLFFSEYSNEIVTTVAADEGGNFIGVRPKPLKPAGDYGIKSLSKAVDAAGGIYVAQFEELEVDADNQPRASDGEPDIGADESAPADDFNDGDFAGWSVVDQGGRSAPSAWSAATGALIQSSNIRSGVKGTQALGMPGTYAWYIAGAAWINYRTTLTISSNDDDGIGFMFRYQDRDNYYRFSWDRQRKYRRLIRKVDGVIKLLAEDAKAYVKGREYQLEVTALGSDLEVSIDGDLVFSVNDNKLSSGTIALYSWGNVGSKFDNVVVELVNMAPEISSVTAEPA
ncbi:MAG: hypothetical protein ACYSYT_05055, partial [Planctomycetota bacterium]